MMGLRTARLACRLLNLWATIRRVDARYHWMATSRYGEKAKFSIWRSVPGPWVDEMSGKKIWRQLEKL